MPRTNDLSHQPKSLITLPLACTVRGCGLPLIRRERTYVCARRHSYDIARSGYINLLQPRDRRSLTAGDPSAAVEARARLLDAGIGRTFITDLVRCLTSLSLPDDGSVADLGAGTGDALAACVAGPGSPEWGSISRWPPPVTPRDDFRADLGLANADRRLPLLNDGCRYCCHCTAGGILPSVRACCRQPDFCLSPFRRLTI